MPKIALAALTAVLLLMASSYTSRAQFNNFPMQNIRRLHSSWTLRSSSQKANDLAVEINSLVHDANKPPLSESYVQKLLELAREFASKNEKGSDAEAFRRAADVYAMLPTAEQLTLTTQMIDTMIRIGPAYRFGGNRLVQAQADPVEPVLHTLDLLQPPADASMAKKLSLLSNMYAPELLKFEKPRSIPAAGQLEHAESFARTACRLYDKFDPISIAAAQQHFRLGLICQSLQAYPLALQSFEQAKNIAEKSQAPDELKFRIKVCILEATGYAMQAKPYSNLGGAIAPLMHAPSHEMLEDVDTVQSARVVSALIKGNQYKSAIATAATIAPKMCWEVPAAKGQADAASELLRWSQELEKLGARDEIPNLYDACLSSVKSAGQSNTFNYFECCVNAAKMMLDQQKSLMVAHFAQVAIKEISSSDTTLSSKSVDSLFRLGRLLVSANDLNLADDLFSHIPEISNLTNKQRLEFEKALLQSKVEKVKLNPEHYAKYRSLVLNQFKPSELKTIVAQLLENEKTNAPSSFQLQLLQQLLLACADSFAQNVLPSEAKLSDLTEECAIANEDFTSAIKLRKLTMKILEKDSNSNGPLTFSLKRYYQLLQSTNASAEELKTVKDEYLKRTANRWVFSGARPEIEQIMIESPEVGLKKRLPDLMRQYVNLTPDILRLNVISASSGFANRAYVSNLCELALKLESMHDFENSRIIAAFVNNLFPELPDVDKLTLAYPICSMAAQMPIPANHHRSHVIEPAGAETLPLVTNILPTVNGFECANIENISAPLIKIRDAYLEANNIWTARGIAETVYALAHRFRPNSENEFDALMALSATGSVAVCGDDRESSLQKALEIADSIHLDKAQRFKAVTELLAFYAYPVRDAVRVKAFYMSHRAEFEDSTLRSAEIMSCLSNNGLDKEALAYIRSSDLWTDSNNSLSDAIQNWTNKLLQKLKVAEAEEVYDSVFASARNEKDKQSNGYSQICRYAVQQFLKIGKISTAEKYANLFLGAHIANDSEQVRQIAQFFIHNGNSEVAERILSSHKIFGHSPESEILATKLSLAKLMFDQSRDEKGIKLCEEVRQLHQKELKWPALRKYTDELTVNFERERKFDDLIALLQLIGTQLNDISLSISLENYARERHDFHNALMICKARLDWRLTVNPAPIPAYEHYAELLRQAGQTDKAMEYEALVAKIKSGN